MKPIDPYVGKLFVPGDGWNTNRSRFPGSIYETKDRSFMPVLYRAWEGNHELYEPNDDIWIDMLIFRHKFDGPALCVRKFELFYDALDHNFHLEIRRQAYRKFTVYEFLLGKQYFLVKDRDMHMLQLAQDETD